MEKEGRGGDREKEWQIGSVVMLFCVQQISDNMKLLGIEAKVSYKPIVILTDDFRDKKALFRTKNCPTKLH